MRDAEANIAEALSSERVADGARRPSARHSAPPRPARHRLREDAPPPHARPRTLGQSAGADGRGTVGTHALPCARCARRCSNATAKDGRHDRRRGDASGSSRRWARAGVPTASGSRRRASRTPAPRSATTATGWRPRGVRGVGRCRGDGGPRCRRAQHASEGLRFATTAAPSWQTHRPPPQADHDRAFRLGRRLPTDARHGRRSCSWRAWLRHAAVSSWWRARPGDHGDLLGLATAAPRPVAGGENPAGQVCRPEQPRLPPASIASGPPVAGEEPGLFRSPAGLGRWRGGALSAPRPPPSRRSPAPGPGRGTRRGRRPRSRP